MRFCSLIAFGIAGCSALGIAPAAENLALAPNAPTNSAAADSPSAPAAARHASTSYPWKKNILAGLFWIGENGSQGSAWDANWTKTNGGADAPDDRNGFSTGRHAGRVNPFYVALPFNDLAFPDKAAECVPRSWARASHDGKPVSACKDRWVWIKSANGRSCFAQWEDVGPGRGDDAEYVFGLDGPKVAGKPGLLMSPSVAQYLGLTDSSVANVVSWRFVDDADVPPGMWMKYEEQAVIYSALQGK